MDKRKLISEYIRTQILGVIATVKEDNTPEAALIALTEIDHLELVFGTYSTTRKYQNLIKNPYVAITFGNSVEEAISVQYEGVVKELLGAEIDRPRTLHLLKNPRSAKYAYKPEQRWFKVIPTWVRYVSLATDPQVEFEIHV